MRKNIAVIINYFYPDADATATVFCRYLRLLKNDYNFHVVTVSSKYNYTPYDDSTIKIYYASSFIHRIRTYCDYKYEKTGQLIFLLLIYLFRIRTFVLSNVLYPHSTKWIIKEYSKILDDIHERIGLDCVISVSGIIHPQFAALDFKRKNKDVKWITVFTDPFTGLYIYYPYCCVKSLRQKRNYNKELLIYNTADYNFLHEELYDGAISKFKQPTYKTIQLYYALDDIRSRTLKTVVDDFSKIKLVYAGMLYKIIRNPSYMLSVISSIPEVYLDMYVFGNECDDIVKEYLSEHIHLYERVDKKRYDEMICNEYDILINIGNNSTNQTPSKTLELISTGKPIINFYYCKDHQYEMINKYPLGLNVGRSDVNVVERVRSFCMEMKGRQLPFEKVQQLFPEKDINLQVQLLKKAIDK